MQFIAENVYRAVYAYTAFLKKNENNALELILTYCLHIAKSDCTAEHFWQEISYNLSLSLRTSHVPVCHNTFCFGFAHICSACQILKVFYSPLIVQLVPIPSSMQLALMIEILREH